MDIVTKQLPEIVLTGVGVVSPVGTAKQDFFRYLKETAPAEATAGEPGAAGQLLTRLNLTEPKLKIARYMDPISKNAIVAMRGAMNDANITEDQISARAYEYGVVLGTARGPCVTREGLFDSFASRQGKMVSGTLFSHCGYNIAGAMTAIAYGLKGPNLTVADRGDLGLAILRRARTILAKKRAHTVFAGFTEGDGAARPGKVPFGEFAYLLCLESRERAAERRAVVLAGLNLQDEEVSVDHREGGVVYGMDGAEAPETPSAEPLSQPLPGRQILGDRYLSLCMVGLLSHDRGLKKRFSAAAFNAGAGRAGAKLKVVFGREEHPGV